MVNDFISGTGGKRDYTVSHVQTHYAVIKKLYDTVNSILVHADFNTMNNYQ